MNERFSLPGRLIETLARVRSVGVITGAGVSSESGIRTYRGRGGLYDDPEEGERTVEALSGPTLAADPDRTWLKIAELARQADAARPSVAHRALAAIENKVERFVLLTMNVDGLHRAAGSRNVIEIHGDIFANHCLSCGAEGRLARGELVVLRASPVCRTCGGRVRPGVVLFGELLPLGPYARIRQEFYRDVPDLVVIVGTTALFPYITEPVVIAQRAGRLAVEINTEPTDLSGAVEFSLRGPASAYLPLIEQAL